jgi:hypothetical protein
MTALYDRTANRKVSLIDAFGGNLIDVENEYLTSGKPSV